MCVATAAEISQSLAIIIESLPQCYFSLSNDILHTLKPTSNLASVLKNHQ